MAVTLGGRGPADVKLLVGVARKSRQRRWGISVVLSPCPEIVWPALSASKPDATVGLHKAAHFPQEVVALSPV